MQAMTLIRTLRRWFLAVAAAIAASAPAAAADSGFPLDHFPRAKLTDTAALQNGAKLFVNYCMGCHSASALRYNRLVELGLTEEQIKANLMFTGDKVGDPMRIAMRSKDAKEWFGALPPDLSLSTRARSAMGDSGAGADWVYTYLRAYYRDASRATGWNNAVFENVGMPHPFWELQGSRGARIEEVRAVKDEASGKAAGFVRTVVEFDADGVRSEKTEKLQGAHHHASKTVTLGKPAGGSLEQARFDEQIADLTAFLTWVADPTAKTRTRLGVWVLIFLGIFTAFAWYLNRVYWKDIK